MAMAKRVADAPLSPEMALACADAGQILRDGGLVGLPTETVYGLAADATSDIAVARIFDAKGRPHFNPLIAHFANRDDIDSHADLTALAARLAECFWPGPLTLVVPRRARSGLSLLVSAGLDTVAIRMPAHPVARAVIEATGRPLAAPSANRSGAISPTTAAHVRDGLGGRVDRVLDGGACTVGLESTIVRVDGARAILLRPGGIERGAIEEVLGRALEGSSGTIQAPGMMASHYAPRARLRLNADQPKSDEVFIGFGQGRGDAAKNPDVNLSVGGDLLEAASNLFAFLRHADQLCLDTGRAGIAVAPVPHHGLGEAINDRLTRASAPRDT